MKKKLISLFLILGVYQSFGGNPDRAGGAGATQLLVNPYSMSAGMGGINTACVKGVEAFHTNIAGLAYTDNTELFISTINYLQGTGINIYTFSGAQSIGNSGNVIGVTFTKWDFGNINTTTGSQPDNTLGTFTPQYMNIGFAYAKKFSNSITAGVTIRYITEGISNLMASGISSDYGVQYQTALNPKNKVKKEDFRFGIALRNIGTNMSYQGSGLAIKSYLNQFSSNQTTSLMGSDAFNLPALVHIGVSYDMRLDNGETYNHRLTACGNFNYNAFSSDIFGLGVEYSYMDRFMLRTGFNWQQGILTTDTYLTEYYGISGGCTMMIPVSKNGTKLGIDLAYSPTRVFNGIWTIGLRLLIGNNKS